ncbi:hypothetical protein [Lactococcus kimchii]|uniref:hypothetical protein n=1 Tax=Lactococcus sp. S-13 TaxID=2507158 RepID=UPI001023AD3A|nr:hypothetical protein [Lactococcus sp. S-13]RZI49528.1 hypothetical protein EQJ87_08905 [Lactococcus sp. S-13]
MVSNLITLGEKSLVVGPVGANKVLGFQGKMEIPYGHIKAISQGMGILSQGAWRVGGTSIPGKQVGSYRGNHLKAYVNISGNEEGILVELSNEWKDQLVLGVDDAQLWVERIRGKLVELQGSGGLDNQAVETKATKKKSNHYRWLFWMIIAVAIVLVFLALWDLVRQSAQFAPAILGLSGLLLLLVLGAVVFSVLAGKK